MPRKENVPIKELILAGVISLLVCVPDVAVADTEDALAALGKTVASRSKSGWFSGVAIASLDGDLVFAEAHGIADHARNIPMTLETPINVGSASKMFVAIATAQLRLAGAIEYEHPVARYLPELTDRISDRVTIADLLGHTSGLADFTQPELWEQLRSAENNHDIYEIAAVLDATEQPGGTMRYTNANYVFLGEIIERLTETSFEEHIVSSIFEPAGMESTHFIVAGDRAAGPIAMNYMDVPPERAFALMSDRAAQREFATRSQANEAMDGFIHEAPLFGGGMVANGAGGVYSTGADLLRFVTALRKEALLPWDEVVSLCTPRSPPRRSGRAYGLGCESRYTGTASESIGHGGASFGMQAWMLMYPEPGLDLVILSNHDRQADPIHDSVNNALQSDPDDDATRH